MRQRHLFKLYNEAILRDRKTLRGFIFSGRTLNNVRPADETVLIAVTEGKLQGMLYNVVKETKKKELTKNCKQRECMVVSKR